MRPYRIAGHDFRIATYVVIIAASAARFSSTIFAPFIRAGALA